MARLEALLADLPESSLIDFAESVGVSSCAWRRMPSTPPLAVPEARWSLWGLQTDQPGNAQGPASRPHIPHISLQDCPLQAGHCHNIAQTHYLRLRFLLTEIV